jgi:hypothetical protein
LAPDEFVRNGPKFSQIYSFTEIDNQLPWKNVAQPLCYFGNFQKNKCKVNDRPMGENTYAHSGHPA